VEYYQAGIAETQATHLTYEVDCLDTYAVSQVAMLQSIAQQTGSDPQMIVPTQ
jgi:hypothetical protein